MQAKSVLVLGGYGVFGSRIVRNLARHPEIDVIVAGRDLASASAFARTMGRNKVQAFAIDVSSPGDVAAMIASRPTILIDTVGPFQHRDSDLARRCAEAGIHYIDIADDRLRVAGIVSLDSLAREHAVAVISGASTVPAISTAIVDDLTPPGDAVMQIDVGISPGNRAPRGLATVQAILSYSGKAIPQVCGTGVDVGWGGLARFPFPSPVGRRWLSHVDTPERVLWRNRYQSLERARIRAGVELSILHLALSALTSGVRLGWIPSLERYAKPFLRIANALERFGSDSGAMVVRVLTRDAAGKVTTRTATLLAENGDGPQIPATPAAIIAKKLLGISGYTPLLTRGALPCIGLLTRAEIVAELRGYAIRYIVDGANTAAPPSTARPERTQPGESSRRTTDGSRQA
jgi:hypothetical protein